jgi:hypothetical protein
MAASSQKTDVDRALKALALASMYEAGAGAAVLDQFRGHVIAILAAAPDPRVKQLTDQLITRAEDLFAGAKSEPDSSYRRRLFAAHEELRHALEALGLTI